MIKKMKRASVLALVVASAASVGMTLVAPAAQADRRVVLPKQTQRYTMGDGTVVTFNRVRERATINESPRVC